MGIPGFYTRIQAYGSNEIIGQRLHDQSQKPAHSQGHIAIIDGPSLAHSLFEELIAGEQANEKAECFYRYNTICKNAIIWLDNLRSFGFGIEGIYFDGALPVCKRQTRFDRLQKYAESLARCKQQTRYVSEVHSAIHELKEVSRHRRAKSPDYGSLSKAMSNLPPPPFLVAAVIEALMNSHYAAMTWVVDGEADEFCVAAAHEKSSDFLCEDTKKSVYIFTNDSDLMIWPSVYTSRIAIIREMREVPDDNATTLKTLCFGLDIFSKSTGYRLPDLIRPAFNMQDPHITFAQALKKPHIVYDSTEFIRFSGQYNLSYAITKLKHQRLQRELGGELHVWEPRLSELVRQYQSGILRNPSISHDLDDVSLKEKSRMIAEVAMAMQSENPNALLGWETARVELEPTYPFCYEVTPTKSRRKKQLLSRSLLRLEMFLPALLDDPERAAAWNIGTMFRDLAITLLMLSVKSLDCTTLEYRRSGHSIAPRTVRKLCPKGMSENVDACLTYFRAAFYITANFDIRTQWRFLIMQLTISDLLRTQLNPGEDDQPSSSELVSIVNAEPPSTWSATQLFARYQAQYYSVKMLKDVLELRQGCTGFNQMELPHSFLVFGDILKTFPTVAQFFAGDDGMINRKTWVTLSEEFVKTFVDAD